MLKQDRAMGRRAMGRRVSMMHNAASLMRKLLGAIRPADRRRLSFLCTFCVLGALPLHAQWTQVWGDDFNGAAGSAPDPSKWTYDLGTGFGDGEIQQDTNTRANSYLDGNGNLVIALLYNGATKSYSAARLKTAGLYAAGPYGRIEARIQNPNAPGVGAAFWALGNDNVTQNTPWPWCGELDMMEITASTPGHNGGTVHGGETDSQTNFEYGGLSSTVDLPGGQLFSQAFHVFAVEWSPYRMQFFMDGNQYGDVNLSNLGATDIWPLNQPIFLILSAGIGAGNSGQPNGSGFPTYLTVDYVHVFQWSAGAPASPTALRAVASNSNAVNLSWAASTTANVTYNVYASTSASYTPSVSTLVAQNVSGTTYAHSGLAPNTTYYYQVVASNYGGESPSATGHVTTQTPGNSTGFRMSAGGYAVQNYLASQFVLGGNTNYHPNVAVNTVGIDTPAPQLVYDTERWGPAAWTITGLNPQGSYQVRLHFIELSHAAAGQRAFNVSINSATVLQNFDIYQAAGAQNKVVLEDYYTKADENGIIEIQTNLGTSTAGDLNPTISAIDIIPASGSNLVGATPGSTASLSINSGGVAVGTFVADEDFNGGDTATTTNVVSTVGVANAAPASVYQSERYVPFTYVLTGLSADAPYTVRMHFAETFWTAAGKRLFNVALNGTQVLTGFDVFAQAGGANKALVEQFTANADMYGQIIVQLVYAGADQPEINGIEAIQLASAIAAPSSLTAAAANGKINLAWSASSTTGVAYTIYRGIPGSSPSLLVGGVSVTTYSDSAVTNGSTYTYYVVATKSGGVSPQSNSASATVGQGSGGCTVNCTDILAINAGGGAAGSFSADADFNGGGTAATGNAITTTGVTNPAPAAVYQSERAGVFTYTLPGLAAGSSHTVRLHFAEFYWTSAGKRIFNVSINGTSVLSNFDIFATAGGANKALVEQFTATANSNGQIVVSFTAGSIDQPKVSGFEVQ